MSLVIVACVFLGVLAVVRGRGPDDDDDRPRTDGVQAQYVREPGNPMPDGPPHVIGFVLGLMVFAIGWAVFR